MSKVLDYKTLYNMLDNLLTGVAFFEVCEDRFEVLYMNNGAYRMLGYTPEDGIRYVNNLLSLIIDEDKPKFWQAFEDVLKDDGAIDFEMRTVTAQGSLRWLQLRVNLYEKRENKAVIACVFLDATDRKFVENEMQLQSEWYQVLIENDEEFLIDYNAKTDVIVIKKPGKFGLENQNMINRWLQSMSEDAHLDVDRQLLLDRVNEALHTPISDIIELQIEIKDVTQGKQWCRIHYSSIAGVDGYVTHIVAKVTNINEKKLLLQELREKEKLDPLTGWLNAEETKKQIEHIIAFSKSNEIHALLLLDMSAFRNIYESLGNETGDYVIKEVTSKIGKTFKRLDVLGRISEDEYVIFIQNIKMVTNLTSITGRVNKATEVTFGEGRDSFTVGAQIGVSVYPYQGMEWSELLLCAERAVNTVKASGGHGYHVHNLSGILQQEMLEKDKLRSLYEENLQEDNLEDFIQRIMNENHITENLTRAALKMIVRHYGFQKIYLSIGKVGRREPWELPYENPGYKICEGNRDKWFAYLKSFEMIDREPRIVHNYDVIPEELSSYMIQNQMHTLFIQPMLMQGKINAVLVMAECTGKDWKLNRAQEKELKRIMQLMQMLVLRYEREALGLATLQAVHIADDFDSYVLAVDYDTYELCFANKKMLDVLPDLRLGECCYQTFAKQESPCEMCIMKQLDRNNVHDKFSEERFNSHLRSWLKMHASWIQNDAGSATCLINSIDISEYFMGGGINL